MANRGKKVNGDNNLNPKGVCITYLWRGSGH
jgi:hypothetical protein